MSTLVSIGICIATNSMILCNIRLRGMKRYSDFNVMVAPPPRELDPQVIVWKGSSVFGKLKSTNDSWIRAADYDILGSRLLAYRCLWLY